MEPPCLSPAEKKYLRRIRAYWQNIICSTLPLNPNATEQAIAAVYAWLGYPKPEIIFVDGPQAALEKLLPFTQSKWSRLQRRPLYRKLWHLIWWLPAFVFSYVLGFLMCWFGMLLAPIFLGIFLVTTLAPHPVLERTITVLGILSTIPIAVLYGKLGLYSWMLAIAAIAALCIASFWLTELCLHKIDQFTLFLIHRIAGRWLYRNFLDKFGDSLYEEFREFWNEDEAHGLTFRTYKLNQTFYSPKLLTYVEQLARVNRDYQRQLIPVRERYHPYLSTIELLFLPQSGFWSRGQWVQDVSTLEFELANATPSPKFQLWWQVYRDLAANCHLLIPFRNVCLVCQRPTQIDMTPSGMLHGVARPAWRYADGSAWYFYRGVPLPAHMGALPPDQWQPDWLLTQSDRQVRRVLIAEIGYERICQALPTWIIDTWQDYTLLAIKLSTAADYAPRTWQDGHILKKAASPGAGAAYWEVPRHIKTVPAALQWLEHRPYVQKSRKSWR